MGDGALKFRHDDDIELQAFALVHRHHLDGARQGKQNIYFTVNVVFGDVELKPNKGAIAAIRADNCAIADSSCRQAAAGARSSRCSDSAACCASFSASCAPASRTAAENELVRHSRHALASATRCPARFPLSTDETY